MTLLIIFIATFIASTVAEMVYFWYSKRYIDLSDYGSCYESYGYFMSRILWDFATYSKKDKIIYVIGTPLRMLIAPLNFACHLLICVHCVYYNIKKLNED